MKRLSLVFLISLLTLITTTATAESLRNAIQSTVNKNPELLALGHLRKASDQQIRQARANYLPKLNVGASVGYEYTNSVNNAPQENDLWAKRVGAELRQPIFEGFITHNEMFRTKAKTNADAYILQGRSEDFALNASETYLNVLRDQRLVSIARTRLNTHQKIYDMIQQRGESGVSRRADTNQAKTRLEAARADYISAQSNLRDQRALYERIIGNMPRNLKLPPFPKAKQLPKTEEQLIANARANDRTIRAAYQDIQEAKGQKYSANAPFWPTIDLVGGGNRNEDISGSPGPNDDAFVRVEANYNLFNGLADQARKRETAALYQEAIAIHANSLRQSREKARFSWTAYKNTQREIAPLSKRRTEAANTVDAYMEQYRLGKRTLVDLLNAENDRFNADVAYTDNLYKYRFAQYRVLNAENRLLQFFNVALPQTATKLYKL